MPMRTRLSLCAHQRTGYRHGVHTPARRHIVPRWIMAIFATAISLAGCHAARIVAPNPPLRAASAALYAIDIEFAEPVGRASAEDPAHYAVYSAAAPTTRAMIASATVVDTLYGRVVQLVIPEWFGDDTKDHLDVVVESHDVQSLSGLSTGNRSVAFRTGLDYQPNLRDLLDTHCTRCHDAANAGGNYRTDTYAGLLDNGSSAPANLIPGDPNCLLIRRCKPRNSMFIQGGLSYLDFEMIRNWIVSYAARL